MNLWLVPASETVAAVLLFAVTLSVDQAAFHRAISLPSRVISGSPNAARQIGITPSANPGTEPLVQVGSH